jgi:hypothetical protein
MRLWWLVTVLVLVLPVLPGLLTASLTAPGA